MKDGNLSASKTFACRTAECSLSPTLKDKKGRAQGRRDFDFISDMSRDILEIEGIARGEISFSAGVVHQTFSIMRGHLRFRKVCACWAYLYPSSVNLFASRLIQQTLPLTLHRMNEGPAWRAEMRWKLEISLPQPETIFFDEYSTCACLGCLK